VQVNLGGEKFWGGFGRSNRGFNYTKKKKQNNPLSGQKERPRSRVTRKNADICNGAGGETGGQLKSHEKLREKEERGWFFKTQEDRTHRITNGKRKAYPQAYCR